MPITNDNHMMYGNWDMEHNKHNYLSFWAIFCPFIPLTTKKRDFISLYWCTTNNNHMMYGCWDIDRDKNFSNFGPFWPFYPLTTRKIKILIKWKMKETPGNITLYMSTINENQMMYGSWDMECSRQNFFFILHQFLP